MPSTECASPFCYLITFSCYGARLHGDVRGSVDRRNNQPGTPLVAADPERMQRESSLLVQSPYELDGLRRECVLRAIVEMYGVRAWRLWATHVRENHVHVVVSGLETPEKMMNAFKCYATRALNRGGLDDPRRKRWSRHGSTRYLWDRRAVEYAVHYVVSEQGEPMALYDHRRDESQP